MQLITPAVLHLSGIAMNNDIAFGILAIIVAHLASPRLSATPAV